MNNRFCDCKACKKMRRKGKVLGTRRDSFWIAADQTFSGKAEHYDGPVSDYVTHRKFKKGRRPEVAVDIVSEMSY